MAKNYWLNIVAGFAAGGILIYAVTAFSMENTDISNKHVMSGNGMGMSMDDMVTALEGKTGDDLDKTFLSAMIVHHEGAIEMAREIKDKTARPELQKLADDIIKAQTEEIKQMKEWQKEWY